MHVRSSAIAAAMLGLIVVAGCGGSADEADEKPKSDQTSESPKPKTEDEVWADSMCGRIDGPAVAKALDQPEVYRKSAGTASVGIPSFETCTLLVGTKDAGSAITFGWSVTSVSEADWAAAKKYEKDTNGRYTKIEDIDVGDGGYFRAPGVAVGRVGDRIIRASYSGAPTTAENMTKVLKLAVPIAPTLEVEPPIRELPACAKANAAAEKVMGAKATIRRDHQAGGDRPECGWATGTTAVSVSSATEEGAGARLEDQIDMFGGEKMSGLGESAAFFGGEDGTSVQFVTSSGSYVRVSVPALLPSSKDALVALAKDVAANY